MFNKLTNRNRQSYREEIIRLETEKHKKCDEHALYVNRNIRTKLQEELKNASKHWRWCGISNVASVGDKLTCWTNLVVGGKSGHQTIHTDIHRYQVNEKDNYAFMTQSKTLNYPFQKWKNKMVYKGGIADENGMLGVALYDDMPIPCALNIVERSDSILQSNGQMVQN